MNLQSLLAARIAADKPVCVGLIGAGKFGSMFLAQVPSIAGLDVATISDLDPERAKAACRNVGWDAGRIARTRFAEHGCEACVDERVEVVVEATGDAPAGIAHAIQAIEAGKHIVMVNVEADALAGAWLARKARAASVIYSMAYGDQPALVAEMVDWARSAGFSVIAAGKGTKYLPAYHAVTPDGVWEHYGLTPAEAKHAGMNAQMFNSALGVPHDGLGFPPCGADDLASVLRPRHLGGALAGDGMVEVVSSLRRDGQPVERDLRWGVYVVFKAESDYAASCFKQYGLPTDSTGRYAAMYKPYHLIGLELSISVLSVALRGEPTGTCREWRGDAVAVAKRALKAGEMLDGEGGYTVYAKLIPAARSRKLGGLPIGLANHVKLVRGVAAGDFVTAADVALAEKLQAVRVRREMEALAQDSAEVADTAVDVAVPDN
jgi:predicted homoserine dehydrogenase-like protein